MPTELSPVIASSQDPTEVANKVKGVILTGSSLIILAASHIFHITLNASDLISLATDLGTVAGAVWAIYGVVLHVVTFLGTHKKTTPAS